MTEATAKKMDEVAPRYKSGDVGTIRQFETLADYVNTADKFGKESESSHREHDQGGFMGTDNYPQASRLAHNGWVEVPDVIDEIMNAVTQRVVDERPETTFEFVSDVCGAEVNMDNYLSGIPENMVEAFPTSTPRHGQLVRVLIPVGVSAEVSGERIRIRGAALMALIQSLKKVNYAVDLFAVKCGSSRRGNETYAHTIHVQHGDQVYSPQHIAFAFGHQAMPRRIGWAVMEGENGEFRKAFTVGTEYGWACEPSVDMLPVWAQDGNVIILPRLNESDKEFQNIASAARWVETKIAELIESNGG